MKKIYKLLLILIVFISLTSLSGCDLSVEDIKEGTYASSILDFYYGSNTEPKDYIQLICTFKRINKSEYDSSNLNVLEKGSSIFKEYYSVEMYIKEPTMEDYCIVNLSNISFYYEDASGLPIRKVLYYRGNYSYENAEGIVEDVFDFQCLHENSINVEILGKGHTIYNKHHKVDINNYEFKEYKQTNVYAYVISKKAQLIIKEISKDDYSYENPNQFQGLYGLQFLEVEFYLYCEESKTYEKAILTFQDYTDRRMQPGVYSYYGGYGYVTLNNEVFEFDFKLILDYDGKVAMELDKDIRVRYVFEIVK